MPGDSKKAWAAYKALLAIRERTVKCLQHPAIVRYDEVTVLSKVEEWDAMRHASVEAFDCLQSIVDTLNETQGFEVTDDGKDAEEAEGTQAASPVAGERPR